MGNRTSKSILPRIGSRSQPSQSERKSGKRRYMYRERRYGGYYRSTPLPAPVDQNNSKATYNNGVLEIRMPKIEIKEKKLLSVK